jgi:thiosulfate reductase cytochrome b subunit
MFLGSRQRTTRKANNLTAIREAIVWTTWGPQHVITLQASTSCYSDSFAFFIKLNSIQISGTFGYTTYIRVHQAWILSCSLLAYHIFNLKDAWSTLFRNVSEPTLDYMASHVVCVVLTDRSGTAKFADIYSDTLSVLTTSRLNQHDMSSSSTFSKSVSNTR